MPRRSVLFSALLALFLLAAPITAPAEPLPVVVSIPPQKYLLERIAGNDVAVSVLLKPGADPHTYEPGPAQIRTLASAAAWFTIGVPFEDVWLPRISGTAGKLTIYSGIRGIRRLPFRSPEETMQEVTRLLQAAGTDPGAAAPGLRITPEFEGQHGSGELHSAHGGEDPHVWLSPMLAREIARGMAKDLGKLLPEKAAEFRKRAEAFAGEMEELDRELDARFRTVPADKRIFLTFHPSWRYFADNYGLLELSIEVEGKEPAPQKLSAVASLAGQAGIRTVFVEPQFSKNAAKAVAEVIGADLVIADPLEENLLNLYGTMADKLMTAFSK